MLCPNCSAICVVEDRFCHNCNRVLPTGLRRATVVSWSCGIAALLTLLIIFLIVPIKSTADVAASLCCAIPSAFAMACVGGLMGWVIARLTCEH
jgi:hypothetical protein